MSQGAERARIRGENTNARVFLAKGVTVRALVGYGLGKFLTWKLLLRGIGVKERENPSSNKRHKF